MKHPEWFQTGILIHSYTGMVCELSEPHAYSHIAHKAIGLGSPDWNTAMENAALITAAPDLLFAAKQALMALEQGCDTPVLIRLCLRDAIEKAEKATPKSSESDEPWFAGLYPRP